ncbi:MAG: citrate (Si)-synthase [Chitinophagales bacterium]
MDKLKAKFAEKALPLAKEFKAFVKENANLVVGDVKLAQVFGGMRGVKSLVTETSELDANEGIRFRGFSIPELKERLPKLEGDTEPLPEGIFYLMLTGDVPTYEEVMELSSNLSGRSDVPDYVFNVLDTFPTDTHPMTQFSVAILSMQTESIFEKRYAEGISKKDYWDPMYEDSLNLIARLPRIAAYIYRRSFHNGEHIAPKKDLDWAGNFAHMLGVSNDDEFKSLMRLYLTIHADHEGGNASAHSTHLTGSTLSDAYYSFSSGMNSLAGPLHGLANQEVIKWILEMREEIGASRPSKDQIEAYIRATLAAGKVIPGYGHAVLRVPDPRFTAQMNFAKAYFPDDELVNVVWDIFEVAPKVLGEKVKIKSPWPNVDAHSGATLMHYGMTEYRFYTVLFGVSRALGVLASLCWDRALGLSIERPKSVSSAWLKEFAAAQSKEDVA